MNVLQVLRKGYWMTTFLDYLGLAELGQKNGLHLFWQPPWDSGSLKFSVPSSDLLRGFHPFGKDR